MRVVLLLMLLAGAVAALAQQPPLRTVTQTVFNQTGKPAARAVVRLSYGWDEMLVLRQGATDAQGTVVWTDVPPVRGVVWGEGIPAGMLPKDGERFTAPLPAPVPEKNFNLGIGMADPGARVVRSYVQSAGRDWQEAGAMYPYRTAAGETVLRNNTFISSGTRVCVAALAQGRPMQLAVSPEFYLPYNDTTSNKPFTLRLAWAAGPTLRGHGVARPRFVELAQPVHHRR